ncbi:hypothetical protein BCR35DRAFT_159726 [Leucosporidium creatinivorum]|uniref:Ornithine decarboxylase antizyme n=1 Tax=Leucosporidium creatinivorum TaxID=106004 RepID=A0A1Y2G095_9BASI|nr:hypothetical protein BCR35DRAFT_159726 [Leucosporidium creatinivorum]
MRSTKSLPFLPTSTSSNVTTTTKNNSKLSTALQSFLGSSSVSPSSPTSTSSITPPPAYHALYPPSPPASPPTLASSGASIRSTTSSTKSTYINPLQSALSSPSTPIKPLLTPRSSHDGPSVDQEQDSNILSTIFPSTSPLHQLPATKVDLAEIVPTWHGAVLENPGMGTRTLYVEGGSYEDVNMRESVCGVLEMAEEKLGCTGVVMVLEKNSADISELIHQLLYVGGTITSSPFAPNPAYILVALDLM